MVMHTLRARVGARARDERITFFFFSPVGRVRKSARVAGAAPPGFETYAQSLCTGGLPEAEPRRSRRLPASTKPSSDPTDEARETFPDSETVDAGGRPRLPLRRRRGMHACSSPGILAATWRAQGESSNATAWSLKNCR